jgi:hypothetical protein
VEVTTRTVHGRYLLRPSPLLNLVIIGVLARLVKRYGVRCIGPSPVSRSRSPRSARAVDRPRRSAAVEVLLQTAAGAPMTERLLDPAESLHAPHLLDVEVAQILRRFVRRGELAPDRARPSPG